MARTNLLYGVVPVAFVHRLSHKSALWLKQCLLGRTAQFETTLAKGASV